MKISILQDERGLGESGLLETDVLEIFLDGVKVMEYDNYLLIHTFGNDACWNPRGDRACFIAQDFGAGFFPETDVEPDPFSANLLCVFDVYQRTIVSSVPVKGIPSRIVWDESGELPIEQPQDTIALDFPVSRAKEEYDIARRNMNSLGKPSSGDPLNNPKRLEYYLFNYDSRYISVSPFEYASRMRNKYLSEQGIPLPYEVPDRLQYPEPAAVYVSSKVYEIKEAREHLKATRGRITADDPIYNPVRLEHYLFEHNPYVSREDPVVNAVQKRNQYLKDHGLVAPYEDVTKDTLYVDEYYERNDKKDPHQGESHVHHTASTSGMPQNKESNRATVIWAVVLTIVFIICAALLIMIGEEKAAGAVVFIPIAIFSSVLFRVTRTYQPAIPGYYNLGRFILFSALLFSTATYQIAKYTNRLVGQICGGTEYPGWVFFASFTLLIALCAYAVKRKNESIEIKDAKKWGWLVPVCASLIFGFLIYLVMAAK